MRSRASGMGVLVVALASAACDPAPVVEALPPAVPAANVYAGHFAPVRPLHEVRELAALATTVAPPSSTRLLPSPFEGRVHRIDVTAGDSVVVGQTIAVLVLPALAQAAADYVVAEKTARGRQGRLEQLLALQKSGMARQGVLTQADIELAEAVGQRLAAEARLRSAGIDPGRAARFVENGGRYWVVADAEGVVSRVMVHPGSALSQNAPVAQIDVVAPVRVEAQMAPEMWAADWPGFEFALDDVVVPVKRLNAAPHLHPTSGTVQVWFAPEGGQTLAAGRIGVVRPTSTVPLYVVPLDALQKTQDGGEVTMRSADRLERQPVVVHARTAGLAVVSGLSGTEVGVRD